MRRSEQPGGLEAEPSVAFWVEGRRCWLEGNGARRGLEEPAHRSGSQGRLWHLVAPWLRRLLRRISGGLEDGRLFLRP